MRALTLTVTLAAAFLIAIAQGGCILDNIVPAHSSPDNTSTASQTPFQDLGSHLAQDPVIGDGGRPVRFADVQAQMDALGCTTMACHGGTQVPVLTAKPSTNAALLANYYDLISGCANGTPDGSDCITTHSPSESLLLSKSCANSGVMHAGGFPFADDKAPMYQEWLGWIAAGAPF